MQDNHCPAVWEVTRRDRCLTYGGIADGSARHSWDELRPAVDDVADTFEPQEAIELLDRLPEREPQLVVL